MNQQQETVPLAAAEEDAAMQKHAAASKSGRQVVPSSCHTLMYAPSVSLRSPARWPWRVAVGAGVSPAMLALGLMTMLLSEACPEPDRSLFLGPASVALLVVGVFLAPVGMLCGLAGILLVRRHLNGWVVLVSILTLPVNVIVCLVLCGIIPFEI
jgi:hypothetical protein